MSNFDIYQNSNYNFDRTPKKTLILRWSPDGTNYKDIDLSLTEPLKIDCLSDVYLDNFTTYHSNASDIFHTPEASAFVLNINEFNIQSNVAGKINYNSSGKRTTDNMNHIFNNIVIPSDALSRNSNASYTRSHKSKKMNYICSINPTTISKVTGKVTDLDGQDIFANASEMFLAEFVFVARK